MNFVERIMATAARNNTLNKSLYMTWFNKGMPISPGRNYDQDLIAGYLDNAILYSIINKIARPASQVPLHLVDKEGKTVENHWVNNLLEQPNEDTSLSELLFNYWVYMLSIGNSYIYAPKLSDGRTIELWTAPGEITEIVAGDWKQPIQGYKIRYGDTEEVITKNDMLHGKLFNPRFNAAGSWLYGLSPISVASEIIRGLNAGEDRMAILAETGGPSFIISSQTPEGLGKAQQEMLEDAYERKYTGLKGAGKPMMTGTPVKVERVGSTAADLDLIKSSEYQTRVLCSVYGIDSVLLNDKASSTYNNVIELKKDLYTSTIMPLNKMLEDKLTRFLIPNEDVYFKFDYSAVEVLRQSVDQRMIALNDVTFLTDNEKREMFNYEPIETQPIPKEDEE